MENEKDCHKVAVWTFKSQSTALRGPQTCVQFTQSRAGPDKLIHIEAFVFSINTTLMQINFSLMQNHSC